MKTPIFPKLAAERQNLIPKAGKQQFTAQGLLITNWVALTELNCGKINPVVRTAACFLDNHRMVYLQVKALKYFPPAMENVTFLWLNSKGKLERTGQQGSAW